MKEIRRRRIKCRRVRPRKMKRKREKIVFEQNLFFPFTNSTLLWAMRLSRHLSLMSKSSLSFVSWRFLLSPVQRSLGYTLQEEICFFCASFQTITGFRPKADACIKMISTNFRSTAAWPVRFALSIDILVVNDELTKRPVWPAEPVNLRIYLYTILYLSTFIFIFVAFFRHRMYYIELHSAGREFNSSISLKLVMT